MINPTESPPVGTDKESESKFISWYEEVCAERLELLQEEDGLKKRIKVIETENSQLLEAFESLRIENKNLREKYEPSDVPYVEPYKVLLTEKQSLEDANERFKSRIQHLEEESSKFINTFEQLYKEHQLVISKPHESRPQKNTNLRQTYVVISSNEHIELLREENRRLQSEVWYMEETKKKLEQNISKLTAKLETLEREHDKYNTKDWGRFLKHIRESNDTSSPSRVFQSHFPRQSWECKKHLGTSRSLEDMCSSKSRSIKLPSIHSDPSSQSLMFGQGYTSIHKGRVSRRGK